MGMQISTILLGGNSVIFNKLYIDLLLDLLSPHIEFILKIYLQQQKYVYIQIYVHYLLEHYLQLQNPSNILNSHV
jgi:hypothetical protein